MARPRALASWLRAMMQPSLLERTTTGGPPARAEDPLAADIEIITVHQGKDRSGHRGHLAVELADAAGHHPPDQQLLVGVDGDDRIAGIGRAELHEVPLPMSRLTVNSPSRTAITMSLCLGSRERSTTRISPSYSPAPFIESPERRT